MKYLFEVGHSVFLFNWIVQYILLLSTKSQINLLMGSLIVSWFPDVYGVQTSER